MYLYRINVSEIHGIQMHVLGVSVILCFMLSGCFDDVERDNPFDPLSERYNPVGALSGTVTNLVRDPISNVAVSITDVSAEMGTTSFNQVSDRQGQFVFEDVPGGTYAVNVSRNGYVPVVDTVTIIQQETQQLNIVLNGAPFFNEIMARSSHINRIWPPPNEFIQFDFEADVGDLDGILDLNRIWVEIPGRDIVDTLEFTGRSGVFNAVLEEGELNGYNVHDIIGEDIIFFVADRSGYVVNADPVHVARIVIETPVVLAPQLGAVVTIPEPDLFWVCEDIPYDFTYSIDIVRTDDLIRNVITRIDGLEPEEVCDINQEARVQVNVSLGEGDYFWTVSIVDASGNTSRSIEAGFVVRFDL